MVHSMQLDIMQLASSQQTPPMQRQSCPVGTLIGGHIMPPSMVYYNVAIVLNANVPSAGHHLLAL